MTVLLLIFIDSVVLWSIGMAISTCYNIIVETPAPTSKVADDDSTVYLILDSTLASPIFFMQMMLLCFFLYDAMKSSKDAVDKVANGDEEALHETVDVLFWI